MRSPAVRRCRAEGGHPVKPVFTVGGLYSKANGVAWIMRDLAAALGRAGAPVDVYAGDCLGRGASSIGEIFEPPTRWISRRGIWLGGLSWTPGLKSAMRTGFAESDVIHNHSLWMLPNSYGSRIGRRLGKPVVITAHGALEPWALSNSGWKKRLVGAWFQWKDLRAAQCIHVNSHAEAEGIRRLGLKQPIAVIPNGVDFGPIDAADDGEQFLSRFPDLRGRRLLLFMARLHEKKGLRHLIQAFSRVVPEYNDWHLVIAGPDDGFEAPTSDLVASLGIENEVTLIGRLDGDLKYSALQAADAYVLPSFSEGFSMSILEAMGSGLPALITPGCNFPEAAEAGGAIEVEPNAESTEAGLRDLLTLSDEKLRAMSRAAASLVRSRYTWDSVARQTLDMYRWVANGGQRPDFILDA